MRAGTVIPPKIPSSSSSESQFSRMLAPGLSVGLPPRSLTAPQMAVCAAAHVGHCWAILREVACPTAAAPRAAAAL